MHSHGHIKRKALAKCLEMVLPCFNIYDFLHLFMSTFRGSFNFVMAIEDNTYITRSNLWHSYLNLFKNG